MEEEGKRRGGGGEVEKDGERVSDTILVSTLVITTQNIMPIRQSQLTAPRTCSSICQNLVSQVQVI